MITVDMAFRINAYGDYAVANALGVISYVMTAVVAWFYLRHSRGRRAEARVALPATEATRRGAEPARRAGSPSLGSRWRSLPQAGRELAPAARSTSCGACPRALRLRDLRPAREPRAVGGRRALVLPVQAAGHLRLALLGGACSARPATRWRRSRTSVWIAVLTVARQPRRRGSGRLCAGAAEAAVRAR